MNFFLDENFPKKAISLLEELGHNVFDIRGTAREGLNDLELFSLAKKEDDSLRAVRCAWRMEHALMEHNLERKSKGLPPLKQGIAVHYGEVIAGNLGTSERLQYTVIGDTVNLASRLESATKELDVSVILSKDLLDSFPEDNRPFDFKACGSIKVKSRNAAIEVFSFEN